MKKCLLPATAILIVCGLISSSPSAFAAPAPVLHNDNASASFGDWYTGAVPANASADKPVLLFVQGLHSNYSRWTGTDSYYEAAYNAGYRTAFVQLRDADGNGGSMWTNGEVLSQVIRKVAAYYNVPKINIIAHSKGGIDTQTALVHYGASPYVNVVHQLSTPNLGSELADMAYSTWTSWLASLIGQQDDAVYSLQTSYMANFRAQTDKLAANSLTKTYMSGGEGDDGLFSSTWFAHAVLPGEDDGDVSVASAMGLPYGIPSFTMNISHSMMAQASQTWSLVRPKLVTAAAGKASADSSAAVLSAQAPFLPTRSPSSSSAITESADTVMRGGEVNGATEVKLPLESSIAGLSMQVMTASAETAVELVSPTGLAYFPESTPTAADPDPIFAKASKRVFRVDQPEAGEWTLKLNGAHDAFFVQAVLDTPRHSQVKADKKVLHQGEAAILKIQLGEKIKGAARKPGSSKPEAYRSFQASPEASSLQVDGTMEVPFTAPDKPGVYNLSYDIEGVNEKGERVVRSINYNFAVTDAEGSLPRTGPGVE